MHHGGMVQAIFHFQCQLQALFEVINANNRQHGHQLFGNNKRVIGRDFQNDQSRFFGRAGNAGGCQNRCRAFADQTLISRTFLNAYFA